MGVTSYIRRQFKNGVSITDTLNGNITNVATSFTNVDGTTFPDGSVGPFIVLIESEKILCASRSGATFTVASGGRGYNGTAAVAHNSGVGVFHTIDDQDLDEANQTMFQTIGAIAAKGDILVGSAANVLTKLAVGSTGQFLQVVSGTLNYVGFGTGGTTGIASAGADGTSTNPARYDHTHQGVASYNGGHGALTSTDGYGITGSALNPPAPAVSMTTVSGTLGSNYTLTGTYTVFLTTSSLAVGTYLLMFNAAVQLVPGSGLYTCSFAVQTGTATATLAGQTTTEAAADSLGGGNNFSVSLNTVVTVTSPGTMTFGVGASGTGSGTVYHADITGGSNDTGYTALRIA